MLSPPHRSADRTVWRSLLGSHPYATAALTVTGSPATNFVTSGCSQRMNACLLAGYSGRKRGGTRGNT